MARRNLRYGQRREDAVPQREEIHVQRLGAEHLPSSRGVRFTLGPGALEVGGDLRDGKVHFLEITRSVDQSQVDRSDPGGCRVLRAAEGGKDQQNGKKQQGS